MIQGDSEPTAKLTVLGIPRARLIVCPCYFALHAYDSAASTGPFKYFGYSGYEHIGKLLAPAVTLMNFAGALPCSTQSTRSAKRSNVFGIGLDSICLPSPSVA